MHKPISARPDRLLGLFAFTLIILGVLGVHKDAAGAPPPVPAKYQKYFVHYIDRRSLTEKALNAVGLTANDVGRSFALIAGVDTYPKLPRQDQHLTPAAVDLQNTVHYLRYVEFFDEIVLLRNDAVSDENFKFFLQSYFPDRLKQFPKSRFLFAYSGHGFQEGPRAYCSRRTRPASRTRPTAFRS